jgi:hypothetical protein
MCLGKIGTSETASCRVVNSRQYSLSGGYKEIKPPARNFKGRNPSPFPKSHYLSSVTNKEAGWLLENDHSFQRAEKSSPPIHAAISNIALLTE